MRGRGITLTACVVMVGLVACAPASREATGDSPPVEQSQAVTVETRDVGSFKVETGATVESNSDFETTKLVLDVTKLDNSVGQSMSIDVRFGEVTCTSRRPFIVYKADGRGGALFEGDEGHHELACKPFTLASEFKDLPAGEVQG